MALNYSGNINKSVDIPKLWTMRKSRYEDAFADENFFRF
jgi:hypothetical protein